MGNTVTICFANNKGGSGKSTSCSNVGAALAGMSDLSDFIVHTKYENLDLVPSSTLMSSVEYELFTKWQREFILRKCLQKIKDSGVYDYILIDAPPTLGGWVMNILCASDQGRCQKELFQTDHGDFERDGRNLPFRIFYPCGQLHRMVSGQQ